MPDIINVQGLSEEDIRFVQKLVEDLRAKANIKERKAAEERRFSAWPLGARGKLTRTGIYDYAYRFNSELSLSN